MARKKHEFRMSREPRGTEGVARTKHEFKVSVEAPSRMSRDKVKALLNTVLDVGFADAVETECRPDTDPGAALEAAQAVSLTIHVED
jgi:hypothetical protein